MQHTTLILGGTGKTGRRLADRLRARGVGVRIGSRTGAPPFDWTDPSSWSASLFRDVDAAYLAYYPDLAVPEAADQVGRFSAHAVRHGVRRIVLLSGRGEPQVLPSEAAVRATGVELTVLRAAFMSQNFSEGFLVDGIHEGELVFPAGQVSEPFVDADDIADVAAAALTGDEHVGATYDLTGPRLLTFADAAAAVASAIAHPVVYRPVSLAEYGHALRAHLPADHAAFLVELFGHVLDGHNAHVSVDVERVLGRPARDFATYAERAAAAGAWTR